MKADRSRQVLRAGSDGQSPHRWEAPLSLPPGYSQVITFQVVLAAQPPPESVVPSQRVWRPQQRNPHGPLLCWEPCVGVGYAAGVSAEHESCIHGRAPGLSCHRHSATPTLGTVRVQHMCASGLRLVLYMQKSPRTLKEMGETQRQAS